MFFYYVGRCAVNAGLGNVCNYELRVTSTGPTEDCPQVALMLERPRTVQECLNLACVTKANTVSYLNATRGCMLLNCSSDVITGASRAIGNGDIYSVANDFQGFHERKLYIFICARFLLVRKQVVRCFLLFNEFYFGVVGACV